MDIFIQQLINGISMGSMYAILGICYSLIIGVLYFLNFALHEVFMVCGYIAFFIFSLTFLPFWVCAIIAVIGGGILGLLTDFVCFRPVSSKYFHGWLVSSICFGMILAGIIPIYFGSDWIRFPALIPVASFSVGGLSVGSAELISILIAAVVMFSVDRFVYQTKVGMAMRALTVNREVAHLMGVNPAQISFIAFVLTGFLAGICAILLGMKTTVIGPTSGLWFALTGLAVMALGGMGNIRGAMVAGLSVGIVKALASGYGPTRIAEAIPWLFLIVILLVKRGGLFPDVVRE